MTDLPHVASVSSSSESGRNSFQYWKWLATLKGPIPERPPAEESVEVHHTKTGKLCPECTRILLPSKVGHGLDFRIDRCGNCGGMWFDANEW